MNIIERFEMSKTGDVTTSEDRIVVTEDFVAVIDGATSKTGKKWDGKTGGQIAADIIAKVLETARKDITLPGLIEKINKQIQQFYEAKKLPAKTDPLERIIAVFVVYSRHYHQLWFVGDCQAIVNDELLTNDKKIDTVISEVRSLYIHSQLKKGKTIEDFIAQDDGRKFIMPLLKDQHLFQNNIEDGEYSYGAIDGFSIHQNEMKTINITEADCRITLASDGYPKLFNTLEKSEQYLAKMIKTDPLCITEYKSTKGVTDGNVSFDDRAFISFQVTKEEKA